MFTSLEGSYSPFGGGVYHEGTPRHEGSPILPLRYHHEGDSQPLAVDLKGGHQTLTNSTGVITMVDSSPKNCYPPRSLQPPRVTRSRGDCSRLAQITNSFGQKREREWIYQWVKSLSRTLTNHSGI